MPQIVFDPPRRHHSKRSFLLGLKLAFLTAKRSVLFLFGALTRGVNREMSERHIKEYWQDIFRASRTQLRVGGLTHVNPEHSYVYMSNHQSMLDIPAILGAVPQPVRMLAKQELFKIPFFGPAMRRADFFPIDRRNISRAKKQLEEAKSIFQKGMSLWLAPEGTRSRTAKLLPFKKGGFHVALQLGIPIVPAWIEGAYAILPPDTGSAMPDQTISVSFGEPIETIGLSTEDLPALMERVQKAILKLKSMHYG